jgi:glycosyltransferase involved in cell wall biosynthesis
MRVTEYINFTGLIPYEELISKIARAHVGIAPMLFDIGVSTKLFEYAAMGTTSVASALPSLTATFGDDCILYYPPGDEKALADRIVELYENPEKRVSLAARAHEFYRNCQWQIMKYEYLKVFEKCLALQRPPKQKKGVAR